MPKEERKEETKQPVARWAAEAKDPAWLLAMVCALARWDPTAEVTQTEYERAKAKALKEVIR